LAGGITIGTFLAGTFSSGLTGDSSFFGLK